MTLLIVVCAIGAGLIVAHNYACQIDLYMEGGRVARVRNTASKSGEAKACLRLISNCTQ